jgi:hypothetical protein
MALRSKRIDYTVYVPNYEVGKGCWDYRTVTKARRATKNLGTGARLRRNINVKNKKGIEIDWWVDRVWEWDARRFMNITHNHSKALP